MYELSPHKLGFKVAVLLYISDIKTVSCLIAVDHHKRRQTDKCLLESYDKLFTFFKFVV